MCGIAGILGTDEAQERISLMVDKLRHRGPNSNDIFYGEKIALGHTRLAIIDLSTNANQPFADPSQRYQLVFNGEIYNFREIKKQLSHYRFITNSDTEVLLAAFITWGASCLERLNGMFAFAIWDTKTRQLFIARDRLGIKPLYYYHKEKIFLFSSEIRSLLSAGLADKKVHLGNLSEYLKYGTVHSPNTLLSQVFQLLPGHYAIVDENSLQITRYWNLASSLQIAEASEKEIHHKIYHLLSEAVSRRMISDVPLGAFLSGGIDSSAIVGLMAQATEQPVNTFSVVFDDPTYDESPYSTMIAKKFNTKHHPILLHPKNFLGDLPEMLQALDHPSMDGMNSYVVSKATKQQGITVALSGLGGDELFAGYPVFLQWKRLLNMRLLWDIPKIFRKALYYIAQPIIPPHQKSRYKALVNLTQLNIQEAYPLFRDIMDKDLLAFMLKSINLSKLPVSPALSTTELERMYTLSQISVMEIMNYTQDVLLRDTDQMSMAHALEVRVPFFDHLLVEYVLSIPDAYKYPDYPKKLLVSSLGDLLPNEIINRPKKGFVFPWNSWLKNELQGFSEKKIKQLMSRELLDPDTINEIWKKFPTNNSSLAWTLIWKLIVLESWLENINYE